MDDELGLQTVVSPSVRAGRFDSVMIVDSNGARFDIVGKRRVGRLDPPLPWWRRVGKGLPRTALTIRPGASISVDEFREMALRAMKRRPDLWARELREVRRATTFPSLIDALAPWGTLWPWPPWDEVGRFR